MEPNNADHILDKILSSRTFSNKETMKGLLQHLQESSKKGLILKEIDIAIEYFKRGKEFVPGDDTIVRVNIHKLRSLLEAYYQEEGKKDPWVIEISKGSYNLKILRRGQTVVQTKGKHSQNKILYLVIAVSLILNIFLLFQTTILKNNGNNPVWSDYMKGGKPVYITLADPFFFRVNDSAKETLIMRDININSPEELKMDTSYILSRMRPRVTPLTYPYLSTSNVWPLPEIISIFSKTNIDVHIQALSQLNAEDIKQNNSIFIGNINSFGYMNKFLEQTSIRLHTNPRQIIVTRDTGNLILSVPEYIHGYYTDYAFLVKIPGPYNNLITMMGDFHASGIKGLTNYITNPLSLEKLDKNVKKDYGKFPSYFEMVVKVTSYNYADFKTEVIHFKSL